MSVWRRQWANLVVIGLAVAALVLVFVTTGKVTTSERESREDNVLSAFRPADLSRISITRGGERLVLERRVDRDAEDLAWLLVEPVREEADILSVDKLLGSLEFARVVRRIKPEEVDLERFGLDAPEQVLKLEMGALEYTLELGKEAAQPAGARYLRVEARGAPGSGVMIVSRDLATELRVDAASLRGRQLVPYFSSELAELSIAGKSGTVRVTSGEHGVWRLAGALGNARVGRAAFDVVLVQLARIKAEDFLPLDEAERALGGERVELRLLPKDKAKVAATLLLGGQCPKGEASAVAIRRAPDPVAACIPSSVLEPLLTSTEQLVDRGVFRARPDEVESVNVHAGGGRLTLNRKESAFALEHPSKGDVDLDTGNRYLAELGAIEGQVVDGADLAVLGLSPPAGTVTLRVLMGDAKAIDEVVDFGARQPDGSVHVRRHQDGAVLSLSADAARPLSASAFMLRAAEVLSFPASEIQSVELSGRGPTQRFLRHPAGQFELLAPKGHGHDAAACSAVVDTLGSLSAERWVADRDDGSFGLGAGALHVRFERKLAAGAKHHHLLLGSLVPGGAYAKLDDDPGIFVVSRRTLDTLESLLIDRSVMMFTPAQVESITLERDGKRLELARQGQGFVETSALGLPASTVQRLVETLTTLRAEAAVHLGPARPAEGLSSPVLTVRTKPAAGSAALVYRIGAGDAWREIAVHYARVEGVEATYVVARNKVSSLLDAF